MWAVLDTDDLCAELRCPGATIRDPLFWFRGSIRLAYSIALSEWRRSKCTASWKLFVLILGCFFAARPEAAEVDGMSWRAAWCVSLQGRWGV